MWKIMTNKSPFCRSGDLGLHDSKSSLKAQRESDEDFVMEASGDSSSCSEDDKDITDEESNGVSSDSYSQEDVKRKVFKKQKGPENTKEESPEDEASSDEEVCSVCEVLNIIALGKTLFS